MSLITVPLGQTVTKHIDASSCGFFRHLVTAQTALAALAFWSSTAFAQASLSQWREREMSKISAVCLNFNFEVVIASCDLLEPISQRTNPDRLDVDFRYSPGNSLNIYHDDANPYVRLHSSFYYQAFLSYYESIQDKIVGKFSDQHLSWPAALQFARVVRNSFAHNGKIEIRNPSNPPVSWGRQSYSFADNGRQLLYNDISTGDVIVLMFEVDNLLK